MRFRENVGLPTSIDESCACQRGKPKVESSDKHDKISGSGTARVQAAAAISNRVLVCHLQQASEKCLHGRKAHEVHSVLLLVYAQGHWLALEDECYWLASPFGEVRGVANRS